MRSSEGFTLVEVMAAALVLVVGMLAIASVLQTGLAKTSLTRQRTEATNLAREITETARSASYASLTSAGAAAELQSENSVLATTSAGAWTVKRGLTTYTVAVGACTFDDPADRIADSTAAPADKCANNPGGATGDSNGDDFRRLTFDVSWTAQGNAQTFTQTTLLANPAGGIGPRIVSFANAATVTSGNTATFDVTTTPAGVVHWAADDGVSSSDAARVAGYTGWRITWPLLGVASPGSVLDGTYTVTAQAFDDRGIAGDTKVAAVTINRSIPFAPTGFKGGRDTRAGNWVDFEWNLNPERDITGYQVFWSGSDGDVGTTDDVRVCPGLSAGAAKLANTVNSCQDTAPAVPGSTKYHVVALDAASIGTQSTLQVAAAGPRPSPPATLTVTGANAPVLTWTAPATGGATSYRVYRGGTAIADRQVRTPDLSFTDGGASASARYYVTAVDAQFNESDPVGPVQWNP